MILALLFACVSDGKEFALDRAAAICAWHERCDTLRTAGFEDEASCVAALEDAVAAQAQSGDLACADYDEAAAAACLAVWADAGCATPLDLSACDGVCG